MTTNQENIHIDNQKETIKKKLDQEHLVPAMDQVEEVVIEEMIEQVVYSPQVYEEIVIVDEIITHERTRSKESEESHEECDNNGTKVESKESIEDSSECNNEKQVCDNARNVDSSECNNDVVLCDNTRVVPIEDTNEKQVCDIARVVPLEESIENVLLNEETNLDETTLNQTFKTQIVKEPSLTEITSTLVYNESIDELDESGNEADNDEDEVSNLFKPNKNDKLTMMTAFYCLIVVTFLLALVVKNSYGWLIFVVALMLSGTVQYATSQIDLNKKQQ